MDGYFYWIFLLLDGFVNVDFGEWIGDDIFNFGLVGGDLSYIFERGEAKGLTWFCFI